MMLPVCFGKRITDFLQKSIKHSEIAKELIKAEIAAQKEQLPQKPAGKSLRHTEHDPGVPSFFCLWLVMWSNSKCKNPNTRKCTESKKKSAVSSRKQRILWSSYPDLNLTLSVQAVQSCAILYSSTGNTELFNCNICIPCNLTASC